MKKLLLLTVLSLGLFSCNDDEPQAFGPNQTIVGFANDASTSSYLTDVTSAELKVPVSLVGFANETLPGEVVVNWSVDASSTAVSGVEYEISGSQSAVIAAGNSTGTANFTIYPTTLDPTAPKTIVINLTTVASGNAIIGEQYKQIVITLQGVCNSQLQGNYINSTFRPSNGATYIFTDEVWTKDAGTDANYTANHVGQYYGSGQAAGSAGTAALAPPTAVFFLSDICDKIKVDQQNLANYYTNIVTQSAAQYASSFVDPDTGVVKVYYSVWFTNNTVERQFIGTYTPL